MLFSLIHSSINPISSGSNIALSQRNELEQKSLSTPQLSQTFAWKTNGTIITHGEPNNPHRLQSCYDGAGGAIITWADDKTGNFDIYAQRIDSNGNLLWGENGTVICNAIDYQKGPDICCDDEGGFLSI
ncbi:MAG: hypothetical protein EU529_14550 [Promethearchaeota archaeon]|nr:MAG: hypothetical protein EU529_14550 [Candidatus Lokiarchaeota archaeon]